jgi:hypothetical protein
MMKSSFQNNVEKYLTEKKNKMNTATYQLVQRYRSADTLEEKLNVSTAISILTIAVLLDDFTLTSKAVAIGKIRE